MRISSRRIVIVVASLLAVAFVALGGVGWYYANVIRDGALAIQRTDDPLDLTVAEVGDRTVTLRTTDITDREYGSWRQSGTWGLMWDGGYGQVGDIVEQTDDQVVRSFTPVRGTLAAGTKVRLDSFAFRGDPMSVYGVPFEDVQITSSQGDFPAWLTEGTTDTWAVFTHGVTVNREEALRALPAFVEAGIPSLVISYRNDRGVAESASGFYDYGKSEWEDLEAAVQYALDNGAKDVILVGFSMGGAITMSFLYNSDLADSVRALVLDAPMLDFEDTINYGAERRTLPAPLTWVGKTVAAMRFSIDWSSLDYLSRVGELDVPVLLFHGDEDRTVHVRLSDRFAELRPDIVTYVRVPGATHVGSWNADPERYQAALKAFLSEVID